MLPVIYEYTVFIGRMQPFHLGHLHIVYEALKISSKLIILLGSVNLARSFHNPWSFYDRKQMILRSILSKYVGRIEILPIKDLMYDDNKWADNVKNIVNTHSDRSKSIGLVGMYKDKSSYYLDFFDEWHLINIDYYRSINATDIRDNYFFSNVIDIKKIPQYVSNFLLNFNQNKYYKQISQDHTLRIKHESQFKNYYNAEVFIIMMYQNDIMLINSMYSKDLYTLPSFYYDDNSFCLHDELYKFARSFFVYNIYSKDDLLTKYDMCPKVFDVYSRSQYSIFDARCCILHLTSKMFRELIKEKSFIVQKIYNVKENEFYGDICFILQYCLKHCTK